MAMAASLSTTMQMPRASTPTRRAFPFDGQRVARLRVTLDVAAQEGLGSCITYRHNGDDGANFGLQGVLGD